MKKVLVILLIIVLLSVGLLFLIPIKSTTLINMKGNLLFGKKVCSEEGMIIPTDFVKRKCVICNKSFEDSSATILCAKCSEITNRCTVCGEKNK